ncbi:MAG: cytochrome C oxidase subunit IV family protein [Flavobacteriaceae bacterium]
MKKKDIITLGILTVLTVVTALFATKFNNLKNVAIIILGLSFVKFLLVAFQFMELKKAHIFWKIFLLTYLSIFLIIMMLVV